MKLICAKNWVSLFGYGLRPWIGHGWTRRTDPLGSHPVTCMLEWTNIHGHRMTSPSELYLFLWSFLQDMNNGPTMCKHVKRIKHMLNKSKQHVSATPLQKHTSARNPPKLSQAAYSAGTFTPPVVGATSLRSSWARNLKITFSISSQLAKIWQLGAARGSPRRQTIQER